MKFRLSILLLAFTLMGTACGAAADNLEKTAEAEESSEENSETAEPEERLNIAISLPEETQYNKKLGKELTNKLWQAGYNIILRYAEGDTDTQREQIKELLEQDVKCLIFCPVGNESPKIDSLNKEDIPVVNLDVLDTETECTDLYITYDNEKIGQDIGDYIISEKNLDSAENVTIEFILGENNPVTEDIYKGLMDKLSPYLESGALDCRSGRTDLESCTTTAKTGVAVMNDLGRYLSGYYLSNDLQACVTGADYIANGCCGYFATNGYMLENFPLVTGVNGETSAVRDFEQGFLAMTAFKDTKKEAETCVEAVKNLIEGEDVKDLADAKTLNGDIEIPTIVLEGQNVLQSEYNDIFINSSYYSDEEIYG
ncbi:MAG: substrate-binding domain-containing protein [Clostridiales bacterium]|nr:substrate-binding domain-containing protein [Clostridiales bacterium]